MNDTIYEIKRNLGRANELLIGIRNSALDMAYCHADEDCSPNETSLAEHLAAEKAMKHLSRAAWAVEALSRLHRFSSVGNDDQHTRFDSRRGAELG